MPRKELSYSGGIGMIQILGLVLGDDKSLGQNARTCILGKNDVNVADSSNQWWGGRAPKPLKPIKL